MLHIPFESTREGDFVVKFPNKLIGQIGKLPIEFRRSELGAYIVTGDDEYQQYDFYRTMDSFFIENYEHHEPVTYPFAI